MINRIWAGAVILLASLFFAYQPSGAQSPPRIVAIGDLHGDFEAWTDVARAAGLIDANGHWAAGSTILVQTGDVPDRGPDTLRIIRQLIQLQREAKRAGGRVEPLVGNHEAMNVTGDLRYVDPGEYAAFATKASARRREAAFAANRARIEADYRARDSKLTDAAIRQAWLAATPLGWVEHRAAWSPDGEIGRWVAGNPAVVQIGDSLFVHGGLSADYAAMTLREINRRVRAALLARDTSPDSIIEDQRGPLWYRGLVTRIPEALAASASTAAPTVAPGPTPSPAPSPALTIEQELDVVLRAFGARRIVVGHTPKLSGIVIAHDGRLVRIDTGMSRSYGGTLSYLEIVDGKAIPHVVARSAGQVR